MITVIGNRGLASISRWLLTPIKAAYVDVVVIGHFGVFGGKCGDGELQLTV